MLATVIIILNWTNHQVMATVFCDQGGSDSDGTMPGLSTDTDTESDHGQPLVTTYFRQHKASLDLPNLKSLKTACQGLPTVRDSICEDEATICTLDDFEARNVML